MVRLRMQPGTRILDWLLPDGIIIDEGRATDGSPCRCLEAFCFHEGILGPVSREGREEYCPTTEEFEEPVLARVKVFRESFKDCGPLEMETNFEAIEKTLVCACEKLQAHGVEACNGSSLPPWVKNKT